MDDDWPERDFAVDGDDDFDLAKRLNALIKTFGFSAEVEVCTPDRHCQPGFMFSYWIPERQGVMKDGWEQDHHEHAGSVEQAVRWYLNQRQANAFANSD